MAARQPWTQDEDGLIRASLDAGLTHREIADRLPGRSYCAVNMRIGRLGLRMTRIEAAQRALAGRKAAIERGVRMGSKPGSAGRKQSPEERAARSVRLKALMANPEWKAKHQAAFLKSVKARDYKPSVAKRSETVLGWCPAHLRAEYRKLWITKAAKAPEARRMILELWTSQLARAIRQIAAVAPLAMAEARRQAEAERAQRRSFAAQMERVKAGGALTKVQRPRAAVSEDRSLTGNSWGLM